jgi:hypothetical protein
MDGALAGTDVRRLDVHLRNCNRCVEHERRLVQATDALVLGLGGRPAPSAPFPVPLAEAPADDGIEEEPGAEQTPPADAAPPAAVPAPNEGQIAAAAEVLVTKRTRGQIAAAVAWNSMIVIAILLALVTIAVTIVGITGGHL